jgi:hypothetical protein
MTETLVPLGWRDLDTGGGMATLEGCTIKRNRVESTTTSTSQDDVPRGLVLNTKEIFVKFDEYIIIGHKTVYGKQIFANVRNMQDISQSKGS